MFKCFSWSTTSTPTAWVWQWSSVRSCPHLTWEAPATLTSRWVNTHSLSHLPHSRQPSTLILSTAPSSLIPPLSPSFPPYFLPSTPLPSNLSSRPLPSSPSLSSPRPLTEAWLSTEGFSSVRGHPGCIAWHQRTKYYVRLYIILFPTLFMVYYRTILLIFW